jgi:uncharacterized membrane protein YbaN (DUF454 family)
MKKQHDTRSQQGYSRKRYMPIIVGGLVLLIVIVAAFLSMQPERSVTSFCRVAKEQKSVLTGNVNYEKRLEAYRKLEAVSPDDIRSDITTIRKSYEAIVQDPSNTISAGLGASGAENRFTDYVTKNCKDF